MQHRTRKTSYMTLALLLGFISFEPLASAQSAEERAGARSAADQGFEAFTQGNWSKAADLFQRAESVVHSPVHLLYLARSKAKLGHLIEAKEDYLKVLREQIPANAPQAVKQSRTDAEAELEPLEKRIPYVSIVVQGDAPPPDVQVYMNDQLVPPALVGVPHPVNPGSYTWQAVYHSKKSAKQTLTLEEGAQETVVLSLRRPEKQAVPAEAGTNTQAVAAPQTESASTDFVPQEASPSNLLPWSYVGFGVGAVGLGLGTVFVLKKRDLEAQVDETCTNDICPGTPENLDKLDRADSNGKKATVSFIIGGLGVAAGATLLVLSLSDSETARASNTQQASISPWIGIGSIGVNGRF